MKTFVFSALAPLVIGPLTFFVMQGVKAVSVRIDALSPTLKRIAVVVVASALTALGGLTGVDFQCNADAATNCLANLDKDAVKAAVAALVAFAIHALKAGNKKPEDA